MRKPFIIAELGSSPAPVWDFKQWCEGAYVVGADAVKVQLFKAEHFPEAEQSSKLPLEFPRERFREFVNTARAFGLVAGASVFDNEAARLVTSQCGFIKLAAREQANHALYKAVLDTTVRTGMTIYRSVSVFGLAVYHPMLVTLFALQSYPAGMVRSLVALFKAAVFFNSRRARWGWSSHTTGALDCVMASRLGAEVIEKHFCLGTANLEAGHSLLPHEFAAMVERIRK